MSDPEPPSRFEQTRWTLVCALGAGEPERTAALESLCQIYRTPLIQFARDYGLSEADSEDVVQDFLTVVVRREIFAMADQRKGRMRTFLLAGLRQQIADWRRRIGARKRGGGTASIPLHELGPDLEGHAAVGHLSPDEMFARTWAKALCEHALIEIETRWHQSGRGPRFDLLKPFLFEELNRSQKVRIAAKLGLGETNVGVLLHRFRHEFALTVRETIADTVSSIADVNDELRELGLKILD